MNTKIEGHKKSKLINLSDTLVAIAVVVFYIVGRVGLEVFYSYFSVTVEEVGLAETAIIARTGLSLVGFLTLTILVAIILFVIIFIFRQIRKFIAFKMSLLLLFIEVGLTSVLVGYALVMFEWPKNIPWWNWWLPFPGLDGLRRLFISHNLLIFLTVFSAVAFFIVLIPRIYHWAMMLEKSVVAGSVLFTYLQAGILIVLIIFTTFLTNSKSTSLANNVKEGQRVQAPIFNVSIERVCAKWVEGDIPREFEGQDPFMYLGQDKMIVLYDYRNHRPLRIPAGKLILTVQSTPSPKCGYDMGQP